MKKDTTYQILWNKCLDIIRDNIPAPAFTTWFTPIVPLKLENNEFTIQVPSQFFYEYLEEYYVDLIHATLTKVIGQGTILSYRVIVDTTSILNGSGHTTLQSEKPVVATARKNAGNLHHAPNSLTQPAIQEWNPNLHPRYSFDNFFEGMSNKLARSVGEAVAADPGRTTFNPFFIYGGSGVGKTHLCHAIGRRIVEQFPQKKVLYTTAHLFQVQYTDAIRYNTSNDFINFYQTVDVLILDDIHEFVGKASTQYSYFHIFNHLHLLGEKQLILTSDKPPVELEGLEERLLTRLKWGMTAELMKPDIELRRRILSNKIKHDGVNISPEVINFIAEAATERVRDLEGIVTSLVANSLVYNRDVDIELARRVIGQTIRLEKKQLTIEKIQDIVGNYFKVDYKSIQSKSRKREIVQARQVAMFLSKKYTNSSFSHIGRIVGKRDHATVLHACKTIQDALDVDKAFRSTMKQIEDLLLN